MTIFYEDFDNIILKNNLFLLEIISGDFTVNYNGKPLEIEYIEKIYDEYFYKFKDLELIFSSEDTLDFKLEVSNELGKVIYGVKVFNDYVAVLRDFIDYEYSIDVYRFEGNRNYFVFNIINNLLEPHLTPDYLIWYIISMYYKRSNNFKKILFLSEDKELKLRFMIINNGIFDFKNDKIKIEISANFELEFFEYFESKIDEVRAFLLFR